jgi:hypothetical protein
MRLLRHFVPRNDNADIVIASGAKQSLFASRIPDQTVCSVGRAGCSTNAVIFCLVKNIGLQKKDRFKAGEQSVRPTIV